MYNGRHMTAYEWESLGYRKSPFRLPTDRTVLVLANAAGQARRAGASGVNRDHLLLGLTDVADSMAARILEAMGIRLDQIRERVPSPNGEASGDESRPLLLAKDAMRVIDYAYDEARLLDNLFIGVEHLLMGLLRDGEGTAWQILTGLGVDLDDIRRAAHSMKWG